MRALPSGEGLRVVLWPCLWALSVPRVLVAGGWLPHVSTRVSLCKKASRTLDSTTFLGRRPQSKDEAARPSHSLPAQRAADPCRGLGQAAQRAARCAGQWLALDAGEVLEASFPGTDPLRAVRL